MSARTASVDALKVTGVAGARSAGLPVTRDLTFAYAGSLVIAFLVFVVACAGLLFRATIYPADELLLAFAPVDAYHLVVGLPVLLGSMWLARRGKLAGLLFWPGALLYVLYSFVLNLIGVPFGVLFLPYLLLVTISAYTMIGLVASIDAQAVRRRLAGAVPVRTTGWVLVILSGLFVLLAVTGILTALAKQSPVGPLDLMLWIADLGTIVPACILGGIMLLWRRALGYVAGTGLLLAYTMLFFGLVPVMLFTALYDGSPVDVAGLVMMALCGLATLALLVLFVRAAGADRSVSPHGDAGR